MLDFILSFLTGKPLNSLPKPPVAVDNGPIQILPKAVIPGHRHISPDGRALLKVLEGTKKKGNMHVAYKDQGGVWTIGYGHTGRDVLPGQMIPDEEAESLLTSDLYFFEKKVMEEVHVPLTDNQFAAITIWAYNLGVDWLDDEGQVQATFIKNLNKGDYAGVPAGLRQFNKSRINGVLQENPGLVNRRNAEVALWLK